MAVTLTEPRAFDYLIEQVEGLADEGFLAEVAAEMADEVERLIQRGFQTATDPYGNVWAPRKLAAGRRVPPHPPLDDSGLMRSEFHVEHSSAGVKVDNPVVYSPFQNYGTKTIDARAMLPDERDLGEWEQPLTDAAQRVFNRHLSKAA